MKAREGKTKSIKPFSVETVTTFLYWLAIFVLIIFAYGNIKPYVLAVGWLFGNQDFLVNALGAIPFVGWIFKAVAGLFGGLVGVALWALLQTFQLYPIFLRRDRRFMSSIIDKAESFQKYSIKSSDDPVMQTLKRWYNMMPTRTVSQAKFYALAAYAIDFCVCLLVYPPVAGGFNKLMFVLMTGQFSQIDWRNVWLLMLTIYSVEALFLFILWLRDVLYYVRSNKNG